MLFKVCRNMERSNIKYDTNDCSINVTGWSTIIHYCWYNVKFSDLLISIFIVWSSRYWTFQRTTAEVESVFLRWKSQFHSSFVVLNCNDAHVTHSVNLYTVWVLTRTRTTKDVKQRKKETLSSLQVWHKAYLTSLSMRNFRMVLLLLTQLAAIRWIGSIEISIPGLASITFTAAWLINNA